MKRLAVGFWSFALGVAFLSPARATAAQISSPAQQLYGTWYTYPLGNPDTDSIRREFRHNSNTGRDELIVTHLCPGTYRAVIAKAVSPIEITDSSIKVLKSDSDTEKGELNSLCQVSVEARVLGYGISPSDGHLQITNPGGTPPAFELARQDVTSEATLAPSIYGSWLLPLQEENGAKVQIKLVFYNSGDTDRGKIRQISVCSRADIRLTSQVDAAVKVGKDEITILDSAAHEQRNGAFTCKATITPGTLHYAISANGATMNLSTPGGRPLTLTRDHSDLN